MHAMIAIRRDEPHWLLNDADAQVYGKALQNAMRHIPIRRAQKTLDFAMLIIAACQFDIPRIYLSSQIARARVAQRRAPGPTVYPFSQPGTSPPAGAASGTSPSPAGGNGAANPDMSIEPESVEPRFGP